MMGKVYSRVVSDVCCTIPTMQAALSEGTQRDWLLLLLAAGRQRLLLTKPYVVFNLFPESGSSSLSSRVIGEQAVSGKPPTGKRRNVCQAIETLLGGCSRDDQQVLAPPITGDWQNLPEKRSKPWQPCFCGHSRAIVERGLRLLSIYYSLYFISEERNIKDNFAIHPNYTVSQ